MLEVVDELERNGHNPQHFSRELSRYFRNLLVARIAGADTRLVAASRGAARAAGGHRRAVFRRGPDALPAALARPVQRSAILAAAPVSSGDRAGAAGAGRPAAADRAGAGGSRRLGGADGPPPTPTAPPPRERRRARARPRSSAAPCRPFAVRTGSRQEGRHASAGAAVVGASALAPRRSAADHGGRSRASGCTPRCANRATLTWPTRWRMLAHRRSGRRNCRSSHRKPTRCISATAAFDEAVREVFGRPLRIKVTVGEAAAAARPRWPRRRQQRRRSHRPRAGQPGSAALPRSVRRRSPQSSKPQGVAT